MKYAKPHKPVLIKKNKLVEFPVGSLVSMVTPYKTAKLDAKYVGPFKVLAKNQGGAYTLQDKTGQLLPSKYPPSLLKSVSEDPIIAGERRYEVEAIVNHRGVPGKYQYRVRWHGYTEDDDTWEDESHFDDVNVIVSYWTKRNQSHNQCKAGSKKRQRELTRQVRSQKRKRTRRA